jgi:hypothetical protein
MWRDNRQAWELAADGTWRQRSANGNPEIATHRDFVERYRVESRPGTSPAASPPGA